MAGKIFKKMSRFQAQNSAKIPGYLLCKRNLIMIHDTEEKEQTYIFLDNHRTKGK